MSWPLSTDYGEAIQNLAVNFQDPEIRLGRVAANGLGQPLVWTGNFAAVFQVHGAAPPQKWAVKCFTRQVKGLQERYRRIDAHLRQQRLPFMVGCRYLPDEVLVRGQRFPALKMDWVEGLALDQFLTDCLRKGNAKGTLRILCDMWVKLAQRLRAADVAHGDLQHGNVLLVPVPGKEAYNLRLIDYDGMYVPALGELPPGEVGHAAYQHPERLATGAYGPEIDRFSHLLIYTTLRCLIAGGRELWDRHYNEERLLLGPLDLLEPETSRVFEQLWKLEDAAARSLVGHLLLASKSTLATAPLLDAVVPDSEVVPLTGDQLRLVEQWLPQRISQAPPRPKMTAPIDVPDPGDLSTEPPEQVPVFGIKEWVTEAPVSSNPLIAAWKLLASSALSAGRKAGFNLPDWLQRYGQVLTAVGGGVFALLMLFFLWYVFSGPSSTADRTVATADGVTEMEEETPGHPVPTRPTLAVSPFDADAARGHQQRWAEFLGVEVDFTNSIGMKLTLIPAGEFLMGASDSDRTARDNEKPQHQVRVTRPFYLGVYEVTQGEYAQVMGVNPSRFKISGGTAPVESVSWDESVEFCRRLSALTGETYRLPTEAEWEYVCRAGSTTSYSFGESAQSLGNYAWYGRNANSRTHPVGQKQPNGWGLYDLHGNVWEWCADWYVHDYYTKSPAEDPTGPNWGSSRVLRGGSWNFGGPDAFRCVYRNNGHPGGRSSYGGFRVSRTLTP